METKIKARQIFRQELGQYMVPSHPYFKQAIKADRAFLEWEASPNKKSWKKFLKNLMEIK